MWNLDKEIQPTYDKCSICIMMTQLFIKSEKLQTQILRQTQKHTLRLALFGLLIVDRMHGLNSLDQSKIELKQYILI